MSNPLSNFLLYQPTKINQPEAEKKKEEKKRKSKTIPRYNIKTKSNKNKSCSEIQFKYWKVFQNFLSFLFSFLRKITVMPTTPPLYNKTGSFFSSSFFGGGEGGLGVEEGGEEKRTKKGETRDSELCIYCTFMNNGIFLW